MTKVGKYTTTTKETTLTVPEGRVGKFDLVYKHIHQEEDLSRVNYYTPENEREDKRIYFEFNGYQFEAVAYQFRPQRPYYLILEIGISLTMKRKLWIT